MKTYFRISAVVLIMLFVTSTACDRAPGQQKKQLGIATYSVKGLESDIDGSFQSLANDGYVVMEISNYNGADGTVAGYYPGEYADLAEKYGLDIISSHARAKFDINDVEGTLAAWGKVFDDHKAMGCKYVILPMNFWGNTVEQIKVECDLMNKIGEEANKRGIKFGYHNHNMEFDTIPGTDQLIEDFLIANTDPEKVFFQMDVFWVTIGGQDPVEYLRKYPDRFKILHIKDDYVIGESGKIDFEAIFNQFYENGQKDWFVEIEEKMTEEQMQQMLAMIEMMRERQRLGGGQERPRREEGQQAQGEEGPQARERDQGGPPPGGFPERSPEEVAEQLKTSLEAISQSALYLKNAEFVK